MYASFIETEDKNFAIVAPSRSSAGARELAIRLSHRVSCLSYCEFLFDESDVQDFIDEYAGDGDVEVERIGF